MAVVPSFPLLNLPYIPLNEVMSYMDSIDLFCFLMVSKKTAKLMKEKHTLTLEFIDKDHGWKYKIVCKKQNGSRFLTIKVEDKKPKYSDESDMISRKLYGMSVPMKFENGNIITLWENAFDGFQKMTSLVCNIFEIQSFQMDIHVVVIDELHKTIEYIQKLESELKINLRKVNMTADTRNRCLYGDILKKCINVPELKIFSEEMKYQHNMFQPDEERYLEELSAEWFTFEDINLIMKCERIKLWDLKWTSQEMNQFLKKWIESTMMKTVELTMKTMDFRIALDGLSVTPQRRNVRFLGIESELRDCCEIQRVDGVNAYIWSYGGNLIMQTY